MSRPWKKHKTGGGSHREVVPDGYERVCFAAMLWGTRDHGRYILEALMCGAHLQTYSDKGIRRIMYLCPDIAEYPGAKLLSLVWEVRMCEHLATNQRLRDGAHRRLKEVWSKLQLWKLLDREFDLYVIIDTDTMAIQPMNELFWHETPGGVWRGTKHVLQGKKRPADSCGTPAGGGRPLGDEEMLKHVETYEAPGLGAEQDFLGARET